MNPDLVEKIFTAEIKKKTDAVVAQYETKRASILEVLRILMEELGYITPETEEAVAQYLEIPPIDVREVMTFYTLFYKKPRAKIRFHVCRTLSCHLLGSDKVIRHLEEKFGIKAGESTRDNRCSIDAVECLGACEIAPMMQVNDDEYVGKLTIEKVDKLLKEADSKS